MPRLHVNSTEDIVHPWQAAELTSEPTLAGPSISLFDNRFGSDDEQRTLPHGTRNKVWSRSLPIALKSRARYAGLETTRLVKDFLHPAPVLLKVKVAVSHGCVSTHAWCQYATRIKVGPRAGAKIYVPVQAFP